MTLRIKKAIIIAIAILGACAICFFSVQTHIHRAAKKYIVTCDTAPQCDAVMVPGAMVYSNGQPSQVLEDRLLYALQLYEGGKAKKILVSGDHGKKDYDEVNVMRNYLMDKGVAKEDIFMDHAGFDTYDSMYRAKSIFQVNTLLVATQEFHIERAIYIARKMGIEAYGYPSPDRDIYNMEWLKIRESLARCKAFVDTDIIKRKPKFGGEAIPISGSGIMTED